MQQSVRSNSSRRRGADSIKPVTPTVLTRKPAKPKTNLDVSPTVEKENLSLSQADMAHLDDELDQLESKYNIEGMNTIDIVYARRENDAAQKHIAKSQKQLEESEARNTALQLELEALKLKDRDVEVPVVPNVDANQAIADNANELAQERARNAELQKQLDELSNAQAPAPPSQIPRPAGSAGTNFNIQNEMGLGTGRTNCNQYLCLMRNLHDLTIQSGMNWELTWSELPASGKAKLFDVARARHPILANYVNDWATEEIVKQFMKNKRKHLYKNGGLEVPAKFAYLKANSAKRDPSASRKRRTVTVTAHKRAATAAQKSHKKAKAKKNQAQKRVVDNEQSGGEEMDED
ncbi:hypothetical protein C8R43DRAFT_1135292 [Mycena crocata]|nr:hypothetical protein C8R43DRAFT_1135292 [Mycena crocata]